MPAAPLGWPWPGAAAATARLGCLGVGRQGARRGEAPARRPRACASPRRRADYAGLYPLRTPPPPRAPQRSLRAPSPLAPSPAQPPALHLPCPYTCALQVSPTVKAVAGSIGGVVEACMLQPIDVMKTRLQLDHSGQYKGELVSSGCTGYIENWSHWVCWASRVNRPSEALTLCHRRQGILRPVHGAAMAGQGRLRPPRGSACCWARCRAAAPLTQRPAALAHLASPHPAGMIHCGRTIAREEGIKSLWKGLTPFVGQLTLKYALRMGSNAFFLELLRDKASAAWLRFAALVHSAAPPCLAPFH